jgi:hypothetical protein
MGESWRLAALLVLACWLDRADSFSTLHSVNKNFQPLPLKMRYTLMFISLMTSSLCKL